MIVSRCSKCGEEQRSENGRQAIVTIEQYSDTGMSVIRKILCNYHAKLLMDWLEFDETAELEKTAGRGTD